MNERRNAIIVLLIVLLLIPSNAAASHDANGGMVKPDSPLYFLDTTFDSIMTTLGIKSTSEVAKERLNEVIYLENHNKSQKSINETLDNAEKLINGKNLSKRAKENIKSSLDNIQSKRKADVSTQLSSGGSNATDGPQGPPPIPE